MKCILTYYADEGGAVDWLTNPRLQRKGDIYLFLADSDNKRAEASYTSGSAIALVRSDSPLESVEIRLPDLGGIDPHSAFLWDYRYGPIIVFAPVWAILKDYAANTIPIEVETLNPWAEWKALQEALNSPIDGGW